MKNQIRAALFSTALVAVSLAGPAAAFARTAEAQPAGAIVAVDRDARREACSERPDQGS